MIKYNSIATISPKKNAVDSSISLISFFCINALPKPYVAITEKKSTTVSAKVVTPIISGSSIRAKIMETTNPVA